MTDLIGPNLGCLDNRHRETVCEGREYLGITFVRSFRFWSFDGEVSGRVPLRFPRNAPVPLLPSLVTELVGFQKSQTIRRRFLMVWPGAVRIHDETDPQVR